MRTFSGTTTNHVGSFVVGFLIFFRKKNKPNQLFSFGLCKDWPGRVFVPFLFVARDEVIDFDFHPLACPFLFTDVIELDLRLNRKIIIGLFKNSSF